MSHAAPHLVESPPTPAPSPQPFSSAPASAPDPALCPSSSERKDDATAAADDDNEEEDQIASLRQQINALPPTSRHRLLVHLLSDTSSLSLAPLLPLIQPRLQRDFLRTLPLELALHVLSFVDEPKTLVRAAGVSKFWRGLLEDEGTWRHMCWKSGFHVPSRAHEGGGRSMTDLVEIGSTPTNYLPLRHADEDMYTPAGRERRGPWDRQALLQEFAHTHAAATPTTTGLGIAAAPMASPPSLSRAASGSRSRIGGVHALPQPPTPTPGTDHLSLASLAAALPPAASSSSSASSASSAHASTSASASTSAPSTTNPTPLLPPASQQPPATPTRSRSSASVATSSNTATSRPPNNQLSALALMLGPAAQHQLELTTGSEDLARLGTEDAVQEEREDAQGRRRSSRRTEEGRLTTTQVVSRASILQLQLQRQGQGLGVYNQSGQPPLPLQAYGYDSGYGYGHKFGYTAQGYGMPPPGTTFATQTYGGSSQAIPSAESHATAAYAANSDGDVFSSPTSSRADRTPSFSYKSHFKHAFQTEQSWLHGPGRLLSTQMSADTGVVTSLAFDGEWIVVGMETSKIHVFEAEGGSYVRTLEGHQTGVWCLGLVSRGGGPRRRGEYSTEDGEEDEEHSVTGRGTSARTRRSDPPSLSSSSATRPRTSLSPEDADGRVRPFFRPDATPIAASYSHSSPASPLASSSSSAADAGGRSRHHRGANYHTNHRRSVSLDPPRRASTGLREEDEFAGGGMGIGAGGPTGDSTSQGAACATARGWGQDGAVLVSGGCDRTVRVWDVSTSYCIHTLSGHSSTIRCLRVLDARPIAVSGSRDGSVRVWDIDKGEAVHVLNGHASSVRAIDVMGNLAVSGSYDATCRLWNVDSGECLHVFRGHSSKIYSVAFDGLRVVTGSLDSTVRVWSAEDGNLIALLQGHSTLVGQLQLDPRTNTLVTGGSDGRVLVFSLESYQLIHALEAHSTSVTCLQVDERFIVTGGNDGRIKLWDFRTGEYIRDLCDPSIGIWRVVIRDDKMVTLSRREELVPTVEDPHRRAEKTMLDVRTFRPLPPNAPSAAVPPEWGGLSYV
ncbi:hypothetical protein JCM10908_000060 [Rhodotorula pacifica]|uniref:F-box/WD repeat-containing protein n=1 Tax=Rhodotorula pacifica TaxID=1495444 RepID=UPI00317C51FB